MHIKHIVVQGFKTYKESTSVERLLPLLNVVVGRNGAGKLNFFSAIRFVLSDAYTHMTREERQLLIHEGSGTVMSAYVEICFDNSDRRLPLQKDEVRIRRTIGLKKDDYALDGRLTTRTDVMNLLESAGFSKLNPYYIVPQGKITTLTNARDSERLTLLKEVSGAHVFEAKLKESVKEMALANGKMASIGQLLEKLAERLSDLQIELADLQRHQQLQRGKKTYEFHLFDRECDDLAAKIKDAEEEYELLLQATQDDVGELEAREQRCVGLQAELQALAQAVALAALEEKQAETDAGQAAEECAGKAAEWRDAAEEGQLAAEEHAAHQRNAQKYLDRVTHNEYELAQLRPGQATLKEKEKKLKAELDDAVARQRALYGKQSRTKWSKEDRDAWIDEQRSKLEMTLRENEKRLNDEVTKVEELESELSKIPEETEPENLLDDARTARKQMHALTEERKAQWREEMRLRSLLEAAQHDVALLERKINQGISRAQSQGLDAVARATERLQLQECVFGPVAGLFSVPPKYRTAVDVVGGSALFNVVVDSDETALLLMHELARVKTGRVTFMPLNRLSAPRVEVPKEYEHIPLMKKMKYDEKVHNAVAHLFGRAVVVTNLSRGAEMARSFGVTAVTVDGDRASTSGVLTGGYIQKQGYYELVRQQAEKRELISSLALQIRACMLLLALVELELVQASGAHEAALKKAGEGQRPPPVRDMLIKEVQLVQSAAESTRAAINATRNKLRELEEEQALPFTTELSEAEQRQIDSLPAQILGYEKELDAVSSEAMTIEMKVTELEEEIATCSKLLKKRAPDVSSFEVELLALDLDKAKKRAAKMEKKLVAARRNHEKVAKEMEEKQKLLDEANKAQAETLKRVESSAKQSETALSRKRLLESRKEEIQGKIRDLGVLPEEAFDKAAFENLSLDEVLSRLAEFNTELKGFAHINKKALEQYNTFHSEQEELLTRKQELEASKESIEKLMESLQGQKERAIDQSFKAISLSFSEVFKALVPVGAGRLEMLSKGSSIDDYTGVAMRVLFNSEEDEQQHVEQLSGGQKSLCALALILAIQKCDPAPFYLFDEIDANLDTQYRGAVANMLRALSRQAQFICTTFRAELLQVADSFYGVSFGNKVSKISEIDKDMALDFVEQASV